MSFMQKMQAPQPNQQREPVVSQLDLALVLPAMQATHIAQRKAIMHDSPATVAAREQSDLISNSPRQLQQRQRVAQMFSSRRMTAPSGSIPDGGENLLKLSNDQGTIQRVIIDDQKINNMTDMTELIKEFGLDGGNSLFLEIAEKMVNTPYKYRTASQFFNEITLREELIKAMNDLEEDGVNVVYNSGDNLYLPEEHWEVAEALDEHGKNAVKRGSEEKGGAAYHSKKSSAKAIQSIFDKKEKKYYLECNTATIAVHYKALIKVIGENKFDRNFTKISIMPEWLKDKKLHDSPSRNHIPEVPGDVKSVEDLIPGDWVYFENYQDYLKKHEDGPFSGENALYMGDGYFRGFGVDLMTHDDMVIKLQDEYNSDQKIKNTTRIDSAESLDGQIPGINKRSIRRMGRNKDIQVMLADDE